MQPLRTPTIFVYQVPGIIHGVRCQLSAAGRLLRLPLCYSLSIIKKVARNRMVDAKLFGRYKKQTAGGLCYSCAVPTVVLVLYPRGKNKNARLEPRQMEA